jgi:parallel beta-helix repeat protein
MGNWKIWSWNRKRSWDNPLGYKAISTEEPRINAIKYQQSTFAAVKSLVYGKNKICGNIIESQDFTAIPHTEPVNSGGKGGSRVTSNTTWTYTARVIIALSQGPITSIGKIWKDKESATLASEGFSLFTGSNSQNAWGEMVTYHPDRALAYRNLAYVAANLNLGSSASVPQFSFEIIRDSYSGSIVDANPKDIIYDLLTNTIYGAGFPAANIDDLTDYSNYCIANGIFLSPAYTDQQEAQQRITEITNITNSNFVWSQAKLKLIPAGDTQVTGNGVTWTPDLTHVYDLTVDDFLSDDECITCTRSMQADIFNSIKVEFLNRANDYNIEVVEAQDQANKELYGDRPASTLTAHSICDPVVARKVVQLALDRLISFRNHYKFKLPLKYILLDPMDLVSITYPKLGFDRELVRIVSIQEDGNGMLDIEVEEMPIGSASPAEYPHQDADRLNLDYNADPGDCNEPIIFEPPFTLTGINNEIWLGTSGANTDWGGAQVWISDDGTTYKNIGNIVNPIRQGVLSAQLPYTVTNPDITNTLSVDLTMSRGELANATQADADNLYTICYVDGELLAYQTAVPTATYKYNLTYLNRGGYNSSVALHAIGSKFARVDDAFFKIPYKEEDIGKTLYIKLASFNVFGLGNQDLATVTAYPYTINGSSFLQVQRSVTSVVAASDSKNKQGADFIVPDGSTSAQDTINQAINSIPLKGIESGSVAGIGFSDVIPTMTSNTAPSGVVSASSVVTGYTADLVPTMTDYTVPSGTVSASSYYNATFLPWKAFDDNNTTAWVNLSGTTGWLQYQFTAAKVIQKYTITPLTGYMTRAPKNFTLQGSNNGTDWTTLDTQTNQTGWSEIRSFTFANTNSYTYYRLNITAVDGDSYITIAELELMASALDTEYKAFNDTNVDANDCWKTASGNTTGWIQYDFVGLESAKFYSMTSINDADQTISPNDWTLEGSDNGTDWDVLDTQTNITWTQNEKKSYTLANTDYYEIYRINVTANNGHATQLAIGEIEIGTGVNSLVFSSTANLSDNYYKGLYIKFLTGNCASEDAKLIYTYTGSTKTATTESFTNAPSVGDTFEMQAYCGKVFLREGTYIVDDLIIMKHGINLECSGNGTIIKVKDDLQDPHFVAIGDNGIQLSFIAISNLLIDGNKENQTTGEYDGIKFGELRNSVIKNNTVINMHSDGGVLTCGIIVNGANNCEITSNITSNCPYGIFVYNSDNITAINNTAYSNTESGMIVSDSANCKLANNTTHSNGHHGISIQESSNINITGNNSNNNNQFGILLGISSNCNICSNTAVENSREANNSAANIVVFQDSDYNNIQNNVCRSAASGNKPRHGIWIYDNTCNKNIVMNNDMIGADAYGTAAFLDSGTGTITTSANRTTS